MHTYNTFLYSPVLTLSFHLGEVYYSYQMTEHQDKKSFSSSKSSSKVDEKKMLRCYPSGTSKEEKRKHRSEVMKLYVQASEDMKKYDLIFSVSTHYWHLCLVEYPVGMLPRSMVWVRQLSTTMLTKASQKVTEARRATDLLSTKKIFSPWGTFRFFVC